MNVMGTDHTDNLVSCMGKLTLQNQPPVGGLPLSVHLLNRGNYFLYIVIFSEESCIYGDTDTFVLDHG